MTPTIQSCNEEMAQGICFAQLDSTQYAPGASVHIAGVGRVPLDAYIDIRNAQTAMCTLAEQKCDLNPTGAHCTVAHALWDKPDTGNQQIDPVSAITLSISVIAAALLGRKWRNKPVAESSV
jgi:hypothetical protein